MLLVYLCSHSPDAIQVSLTLEFIKGGVLEIRSLEHFSKIPYFRYSIQIAEHTLAMLFFTLSTLLGSLFFFTSFVGDAECMPTNFDLSPEAIRRTVYGPKITSPNAGTTWKTGTPARVTW
jgi:hypothetical protein